MKTFMPIKYAVALLPALAMGISIASADETKRDRPCDDKQGNVHAEKNHSQKTAQKESQASDRASSVAKSKAAANAAVHESQYVTSKPTDNYFSGNIVGHDVMNRRDNKIIGTVNELLIDRNGQIGAVIVSTGGVMGLGEKDLAIAWDQIERKVNGEDITLSVDFSEASLVDAPSFARK